MKVCLHAVSVGQNIAGSEAPAGTKLHWPVESHWRQGRLQMLTQHAPFTHTETSGAQSESALHVLPPSQGGHVPPPQSMAVSSPSFTPSWHRHWLFAPQPPASPHSLSGSSPSKIGAHVPLACPVLAIEHASHFRPHMVAQQTSSCVTHT